MCLGVGNNNPESKTVKKGSLVIVSCRISSNKRDMRIKVIRKFQTIGPVVAIGKLDDRRLLYSCGNSLNMITFEARNEAEGHRY
jgi:hypothetical protein